MGSAQEEDGNLVASETTAENSIAVLGGTTASGATNSIALGGAVDADGDYVRSETKGKNSIAVLGGTTDTNATNSLAIGLNSVAMGTNSIAIGRGGKDSGGDIVGSTANAENSLAVLGGMIQVILLPARSSAWLQVPKTPTQ